MDHPSRTTESAQTQQVTQKMWLPPLQAGPQPDERKGASPWNRRKSHPSRDSPQVSQPKWKKIHPTGRNWIPEKLVIEQHNNLDVFTKYYSKMWFFWYQ